MDCAHSLCFRHPATTHGPPLGIGWQYEEKGSFNLEDYENARRRRLNQYQLLVPSNKREEMLMNSGHSMKEISEVMKKIEKSRRQRQSTLIMQEFEDWYAFVELCKRRYKRWKTGISKQREQELLWENAMKLSVASRG